MIMLSHNAQVKRFTVNLLRALRSQPTKQALVSVVPTLIARVLEKPFNICEYGVCDLMDILMEIPAMSVEMTTVEDNLVVLIPKKEQSPASNADETVTEQTKPDIEPKKSKQDQAQDKVERIHQFAQDCVLLLKHKPEYRIPLQSFVSSFGEYFGRMLKLPDFGFKKVSQLIQAVPGVVEITTDSSGQWFIQLIDSARLSDKIRVRPKIQMESTGEDYGNGEQEKGLSQMDLAHLREQFAQECDELLKGEPDLKLPLNRFAVKYNQRFKKQVKVADYGVTKMIDLFMLLPNTVRVTENSFGERFIRLKDTDKVNSNSGETSANAADSFPSNEISESNEEMDKIFEAGAEYVAPDVQENNDISDEDVLNGVKSLNLKKLLSCTACKLTARTPVRSCGDGHSICALCYTSEGDYCPITSCKFSLMPRTCVNRPMAKMIRAMKLPVPCREPLFKKSKLTINLS